MSKEDDEENARLQSVVNKLTEEYDAVVLLCSRHESFRTLTRCKGAGNWHAQYGLVREWLTDTDEKNRLLAQRDLSAE